VDFAEGKRRMRDNQEPGGIVFIIQPYFIHTPISLTAQRNGGTTVKETPSIPSSLLPLVAAKFAIFGIPQEVSLSRSLAAPLPQKAFWLFGDPI